MRAPGLLPMRKRSEHQSLYVDFFTVAAAQPIICAIWRARRQHSMGRTHPACVWKPRPTLPPLQAPTQVAADVPEGLRQMACGLQRLGSSDVVYEAPMSNCGELHSYHPVFLGAPSSRMPRVKAACEFHKSTGESSLIEDWESFSGAYKPQHLFKLLFWIKQPGEGSSVRSYLFPVCAPFVSSVRSPVRFEAELLYMHLKVILVNPNL